MNETRLKGERILGGQGEGIFNLAYIKEILCRERLVGHRKAGRGREWPTMLMDLGSQVFVANYQCVLSRCLSSTSECLGLGCMLPTSGREVCTR